VGFNHKSVKDLKLTGKRVLLRADYNVPVKAGKIEADYRLRASLPTVKYILDQKPEALFIISHLGRPEGKPDAEFSLQPVAKQLSVLLGKPVRFVNDCIGPTVQVMSGHLLKGQIMMLENLRFHPGEEANDRKFAEAIIDATNADVFVQDGFGVVHRAHASTNAITKLLPSAAGLLLQREVETIQQVMSKPEKPLLAIIGGAKIGDKIEVLRRFIKIADCLALGGAMANNFLKVLGQDVGASLYDKDQLEVTSQLLNEAKAEAKERPFQLLIPNDVVLSTDPHGRKPLRLIARNSMWADIVNYPKIPRDIELVKASEMILDIGPASAAAIGGVTALAKTVIWNGTLGMTETPGLAGAEAPFAHASRTVAEAIIGRRKNLYSVAGGGDTAGFLEKEKLVDEFNFVSTGGGAMLELMSGHKLPGIEALPDK